MKAEDEGGDGDMDMDEGMFIAWDSLCAKEMALFQGCTRDMRCLADTACSTVRKLTNANRRLR
jgi:hypothetical protein